MRQRCLDRLQVNRLQSDLQNHRLFHSTEWLAGARQTFDIKIFTCQKRSFQKEFSVINLHRTPSIPKSENTYLKNENKN